MLVRAQWNAGHRAVRQKRAAGRREICNEPSFLLQLCANDPAACSHQLGLVVVPEHRRSGTPVQQGIGTARQDRGRVLRVDLCARAG